MTTRGFASCCVATRTTRRGLRIWRSVLFFSTCGDVFPFRSLSWPWWAHAVHFLRKGVASLWEASWSRRGCVVVSGGALGIDGAAHGGTLEAGQYRGGLRNRVDRIFPSEHEDLFGTSSQRRRPDERIPPGNAGRGWLFPGGNGSSPPFVSPGRRGGSRAERSDHHRPARRGDGARTLGRTGAHRREGVPGLQPLLADGAFPLVQVEQFVDLLRPRLSSSERDNSLSSEPRWNA